MEKHIWSWQRFLYGAAGAAGPEIIRIYKTADLSLLNAPIFLKVVAVLFVLLGALFAEAWEDNRAVKCIYLGASFQVWLAAFAHMAVK